MIVFFFKQKTAYEMRISDWSSDVCSSDLFLGHAVQQIERCAERTAQQAPEFRFALVVSPRVEKVRTCRHDAQTIKFQSPALDNAVQIGRASGRERVCQYV